MSLSKFSSFTNQTLYVNRPLKNILDVRTHFITQGFRTMITDPHVTICFSKNPIKWNQFTPETDELKVFDTQNRKMEKFGNAFVMTFKSFDLEKRFKTFQNGGASYDFASYLPHLTISYSVPGISLKDIKPYTGVLIFGPEEFKKINTNWKAQIKEY